MKVILFGATGRVGGLLSECLLHTDVGRVLSIGSSATAPKAILEHTISIDFEFAA
jgi:hypothetical protein